MGRLSDASLDSLPLFQSSATHGTVPTGVPPEVCSLFERLALEVKAKGFDRYSARALLHRIRWHHVIERGDRTFKANNNWTPAMARWVMTRHRHMAGFFETRASEED